MRTRTLFALVSILAASAFASGCADTSPVDDAPASTEDAISTRFLDKSVEVAVSGHGQPSVLGAPKKMKSIVAAVRLGAKLPAGTTPRCLMPYGLEFRDGSGKAIATASYDAGGCGILERANGDRYLLQIDEAKIVAALAEPRAVGDIVRGVDKLSSKPDGDVFTNADAIEMVLSGLDLDAAPKPELSDLVSRPAGAPPCESVGEYVFWRGGAVLGSLELHPACEIAPDVAAALLKDGTGAPIGFTTFDLQAMNGSR